VLHDKTAFLTLLPHNTIKIETVIKRKNLSKPLKADQTSQASNSAVMKPAIVIPKRFKGKSSHLLSRKYRRRQKIGIFVNYEVFG
jgi:hypothetical protein